MSSIEPQPTPPPPRPPFQFSLRTLLLLFVVLGSSLAVFGAWGIGVFAVVLGLAFCIRRAESLPSLAELVVVVVVLLSLVALLLPAVQTARESGRRAQCLSNLKQIAVALLRYEQANGCFPPAHIADKNGKPMHSWRVLILPYLDQSPLYAMYRFSEPWDGPNNKKLLAYRLPVFECPSAAFPRAQTSYVAVVGSNAAWPGDKPRKADAANSPGGLSKTIMLVEMPGSDIAWTEPRDLSLDSPTAAGAEPRGLTVTSNHKRPDDFFFEYTGKDGIGPDERSAAAVMKLTTACQRQLRPKNPFAHNNLGRIFLRERNDFDTRAGKLEPEPLRKLLGADFFEDVARLWLTGPGITDSDAAQVAGFARLNWCYLDSEIVTDAGLSSLTGLTDLRNLYLGRTKATDEGVKKLQDAPPECCIHVDEVPHF